MRLGTISLALTVVAAFVANSDAVSGQSYPSRPITIIVPFGPGGGNDVVARILAESMSKSLGRPVIVENVPGPAGSLGVSRVAHAKPDGYTIISAGWGTFVANGAILSPDYDLQSDFAAVALLPSEPLVIMSR